ncbi:Uncharacterized protein OBRU01_22173 [Operophtera brumata]|uniref:Uncharacterized protein n=1 Tax=Operophtera brumata TaxID=104452 RepID=A0A0L7KSM9_OPEBR|nr:Uncharacterized protein OBRU01_22173 [Operophtera brumata]
MRDVRIGFDVLVELVDPEPPHAPQQRYTGHYTHTLIQLQLEVWRPLDLILTLNPLHNSDIQGIHCTNTDNFYPQNKWSVKREYNKTIGRVGNRQKIKDEIQRRQEMLRVAGRQRVHRTSISQESSADGQGDAPELV